jgi:hypothetical protein
VAVNTDERINQKIRCQTKANVACYAAGGPEAIEIRLEELDREWDVERCLETMAPSLTLFGLGLSLISNKKRWLALPLLVQSFFLQHALQGWCPPLPVLRRLGIRTTSEIDEERNALKALRGDYRRVVAQSRNGDAIGKAMKAAEH